MSYSQIRCPELIPDQHPQNFSGLSATAAEPLTRLERRALARERRRCVADDQILDKLLRMDLECAADVDQRGK